MPLQANIEEPANMNMIPMIDMVLNLLIFFLVTTKYADMERELDVRVPEVGTAQPLTPAPQAITVNVLRDGSLVMDHEPVTPEEFSRRLREAHGRYEDQEVVVRGDAQVVYQGVANVLSICESTGISHLSLSVKEKQ